MLSMCQILWTQRKEPIFCPKGSNIQGGEKYRSIGPLLLTGQIIGLGDSVTSSPSPTLSGESREISHIFMSKLLQAWAFLTLVFLVEVTLKKKRNFHNPPPLLFLLGVSITMSCHHCLDPFYFLLFYLSFSSSSTSSFISFLLVYIVFLEKNRFYYSVPMHAHSVFHHFHLPSPCSSGISSLDAPAFASICKHRNRAHRILVWFCCLFASLLGSLNPLPYKFRKLQPHSHPYLEGLMLIFKPSAGKLPFLSLLVYARCFMLSCAFQLWQHLKQCALPRRNWRCKARAWLAVSASVLRLAGRCQYRARISHLCFWSPASRVSTSWCSGGCCFWLHVCKINNRDGRRTMQSLLKSVGLAPTLAIQGEQASRESG